MARQFSSVVAVTLLVVMSTIMLVSATTTPTHIKYPGSSLDLESLPKHEDGDPLLPRSIVVDVPKPDAPYPYAILFAENSCKLRKQFASVRSFISTDLPFYANVKTKLTGGLPRLRFFKNKEDWEHSTVDSSEMTIEQMKELLQKLRENPNFNGPTDSTVEVQLSQETTDEDMKELLAKFGVERGLTFHKERIPVIFKDDDDRPGNRQFDVNEVIKEIDPNAGPVQLTEEARLEALEMMRKEDEARAARRAAAEAAEAAKASSTKTEL